MKNRILHYLSSGIAPAQVATIVGCSPSYISQLVKDPLFKQELEELILQKPADAEETDLDNKYTALEHQLVRSMNEALLGAELPAITRALEVVAKRRDMTFARKNPVPTTVFGALNVQMVSLNLPAHALPAPIIELNSQKEIISINNNNLAPMSSDNVKNLFTRMAEQKLSSPVAVAALADF